MKSAQARLVVAALLFCAAVVLAAPGDWSYSDPSAGPRSSAATWPVYSLNRLYVLGGESDDTTIVDSFGYLDVSNPVSPSWNSIFTGAESLPTVGDVANPTAFPGGHSAATAVVDTVSNSSDIRLWLHGGYPDNNYLWYYSVNSAVWRLIGANGTANSGKMGWMDPDSKSLYFYGGAIPLGPAFPTPSLVVVLKPLPQAYRAEKCL